MSRDDNTPGHMPLTRGLQTRAVGGGDDDWVDFRSGEAGHIANNTFGEFRLDPKLFPVTGKQVPVQIQVKSADILTYSSGDETGQGDAVTAANGGEATLSPQTFYQPIWLGRGIFQMKTVTASVIMEYMIVVRRRTQEEIDAGE